MQSKNIRLEISYDGRNYSGWQRQKKAPNVQNILEIKLSKLFKEKITVHGAGRTDAGAHAILFTANFITGNHKVPIHKLKYILNLALPKDIQVVSARLAGDDFHSRFNAKAREYVYWVVNSDELPPFLYPYTYLETTPLDIHKIKRAARLFQGRHDFKNFCVGYDETKDCVREVFYFRACNVSRAGGLNSVLFFIKGSGFLRGMIRTMVSVCLHYAKGKITLDEIERALRNEVKLEPKLKRRVPANGLYFKRAYY